MLLTHERLLVGRRLIVEHCLLLRLDRMVLGDFEALMRLHTTITYVFGALDAPRRRVRVIRAATALDCLRLGLGTLCVIRTDFGRFD